MERNQEKSPDSEGSSLINVGGRIRKVRQARNLTLREIAQRVNLTVSHLSQLERNLSTPSLSALIKISAALDVPVLWLFSDDPVSRDPATRKGQRATISVPHSHVQYELLSPRYALVELSLVTLGAGKGKNDELVAHRGEECIYVIEGTLQLRLGGEVHTVEQGDSMYLQSSTPHRFVNPSNKPLTAIVAQVPPTF